MHAELPTDFTWASCAMTPSTGCEKKITRAHKAKLSRAERKEFRSLMWEMRRSPLSLPAAERQKLEKLFAQIPELRTLYNLRVRFKAIFDTATNRRRAALALTELFLRSGAKKIPRPGKVAHPLQTEPNGLWTWWVGSAGPIHVATQLGHQPHHVRHARR